MSTDLTGRTEQAPQTNQWTQEQIDLLKRTICKGSTNDEFLLFLHVAKKTGLDPMAKQIHAVKRWDSTVNREVMSVQTGIDGYRLIAERTGERDGDDGPYWCGADGAWKEVWLEKEPPVASKYIVYRRGHGRPYTGIARFEAYCQRTKAGEPNSMWKKMGDNQLAKCAEALALRKAFPVELSGVYTHEEMAQASVTVEPSESLPAISHAHRLPNIGRHPEKPVDDPSIPIEDLRWYLGVIDKNIGKAGREKFMAQDEAHRSAIGAEITKREAEAKQEQPARQPERPPEQPTATKVGDTIPQEVPAQPEPDAMIEDGEWAKVVQYLDDGDKGKAKVLAAVKKAMKVQSVAHLEPHVRSGFMRTFEDYAKKEKMAVQWPA